MSDWLSYKSFVYIIGFTAQVLFSARLLLQWIQSERVKEVLTPELFWQLSLIASFLLFLYGWLRDDFAIMLGQSLTYFIYIRNMQLQGSWKRLHKFIRIFLILFPFLIVIYSFNNNQFDVQRLFKNKDISTALLIWGSIGQVVFTLRFVYQWIYSERRKISSLPLGFWLLSLTGSIMILSYAVMRKDPVLFIGQAFGFVVYSRNIVISIKATKNA
ncbi:MAG: lipid-A-disaccharide synthase N-terminal domain-containing protein [Flavobacteriaceae bacterium]|nr:lipid-A-disaccharide synthase N-terminal domain-containing protein [Flavobacteriaceae bacterium]MCB0474035.1 lipid-A-disaccharide synthase N-terminal domain-containing protein [Flavobacteriaceae bacterium]